MEINTNNLKIPATSGAGDRKMTWQRMKWSDNMVRVLIMVVCYIGDEVGPKQVESSSDVLGKKRSGKGKWKSVSKTMMEKGFYVSPQQCEDKFNDLNKRYKRVNDIIGKGIACKVVENQSLLETMDHIPAKMKEEVKKLLNSKHLFFREMCAYHNNPCGSGGTGASSVAVDTASAHHSFPKEVTATGELTHHRQWCVHFSDEYEEYNDENEDEDEDEDGHEEDGDGGLGNRKRSKAESVMDEFKGEVRLVMEDLRKSVWEKRRWMKMKMMQLKEERLVFEGESYELEKRRLRWVKFSRSRKWEMEVEKVRNERMKVENERMVIMLRQKEMELVDVQQ